MAKDFIVKVYDINNSYVSNDYELFRCCPIIAPNAGVIIGQKS